jgi:hypothetical protein
MKQQSTLKYNRQLNPRLTEQILFEELIPLAEKHGQVNQLGKISVANTILPIWSMSIGTQDKTKPCFGLFAGVHGLERVGSHVVLQFIKNILHQLEWDENLKALFQETRIVCMPLVNPGGLYLSTRSNPNGVDIMRNAPIDGDEKGYKFLSGHRISPRIPWFRGYTDDMELETKALVNFVEKEMFQSSFAMAIDVHSGFGMRDRLWYPYSGSKKKYVYENAVLKFSNLLSINQPYHIYKIEKQTDSYVVHGDPWDLLCERFELQKKADKIIAQEKISENLTEKIFIPWCLEMGSWAWLKKNPLQILKKSGLYNPLLPHRYGRIMRRHRALFELMLRAVHNYKSWTHS